MSQCFGTLESFEKAQTRDEPRAQTFAVLFPVIVLSAATVMVADPALSPSGSALRTYTPWLALCMVAIQSVLRAASTTIPRTVGFHGENGITFIDFVGESMTVPPQFCGTMEVRHWMCALRL